MPLEDQSSSLYDALGEQLDPSDKNPPIDTVFTATIETIDNDHAERLTSGELHL